jgi:hypothetical protein
LRFLLLGEYSGLHQALHHGLVSNGHEVLWLHDGDHKKRISGGVSLYFKTGIWYLDKILKNILPFFKLLTENQFDCVHFISPVILSPRIFTNKLFLKLAFKKSRFSILAAAGTDSIYLKYCKDYRYNPIDSIVSEEGKFNSVYNLRYLVNTNKFIASRVDKIVAYSYDYYYPYSKTIYFSKLVFIPMPVIINEFFNDKLKSNVDIVPRILLGANKRSFKGYRLMHDALLLAKEEFKSKIIIEVPTFLNSEEWEKLVSECTILLDQCFSYSPGMNALKALSLGKIVLSGSEPEFEKLVGAKSSIINIIPDSNQIYSQLRLLLFDTLSLNKRGYDSYSYVKKNHSSTNVAQKISSLVQDNV